MELNEYRGLKKDDWFSFTSGLVGVMRSYKIEKIYIDEDGIEVQCREYYRLYDEDSFSGAKVLIPFKRVINEYRKNKLKKLDGN